MHTLNPSVARTGTAEGRSRTSFLPEFAVKVASIVLACASTASFAQSFFGKIDPFSTTEKVAPSPNQPWVPSGDLPAVPPPASLQTIPADLNKPLSLAQLTEIALSLNARTRQAWLQARVEAAQSGIDHSGEIGRAHV